MELTDRRLRPQLHIDIVERLRSGLGRTKMRRQTRQQRRIFNLEKGKKVLNGALARHLEGSVKFARLRRPEWFRIVNHLSAGLQRVRSSRCPM
jgi:hypothetical protein